MPEGRPADPPPFRFGAVILAAGASARMGSAKQLLVLEGRPLVVRALEAALGSPARPVVVVLGSNAESIREAIAGLPVEVVFNPGWPSGMASSIRAGITALANIEPGLDAVLLAPCDQPALSSKIIARLGALHRETGLIAAARFGGRNGAPAVFGRKYFPQLLSLSGDEGARNLLNGNAESVATLELPEMGVDLDTPADAKDWSDRHP
jgi:molybdenum cofactor cytidylyltransferase